MKRTPKISQLASAVALHDDELNELCEMLREHKTDLESELLEAYANLDSQIAALQQLAVAQNRVLESLTNYVLYPAPGTGIPVAAGPSAQRAWTAVKSR